MAGTRPGDTEDSGGNISGTLSILGFSLPDEIATTRVDTFKRAYPQVQVKITEGGFDEQQFLSAVASGTPPDLVYLDREIIGTYAARGAIQPLDQCISTAQIDMGQYRPAATQQVTVDGKVHGIPEFYSVRVMTNNQAVSEAGLSPSDVDTADWSNRGQHLGGRGQGRGQEEPALHRALQRQQGGRRAGLRRGVQAER